jgi:3-oxoadipate enol-lactonase
VIDKEVQISDISLQTVDDGEGAPLVFVHGFPLDRHMWDSQLHTFRGSYRVIIPNLRGMGSSPLGSATISMDRYADDLAELLDKLAVADPVHMVGLSMGGYIAFAFARRHPEKLASLILCDTKVEADAPAAVENRRKMAEKARAQGMAPIADEMLPKLLGAKSKEDTAMVQRVRQMMLDAPAEGVALASLAMASRPDSLETAVNLHIPVMLIVGAEDAITPPEQMRALANAIPNSEFIMIHDAGHLAPMENPSPVNQAIHQFLDGVAARI